jgi:methyltransferase
VLAVWLGLVALLAVTRLVELWISARHRRALFARGARAVPERGFSGMVLLHVAVLVGSVVEPWLFARSVPVWFGAAAAAGVLAANALRIAAIRSLGQHWNVRVVDSTSLGVVASGPYRHVRHPNYVAVFFELLFLPLVRGAWVTAGVGSALHVAVLFRRIRLEEEVLLREPAYRASMGDKPRFFPRFVSTRPRLAGTRKA